MPCAQLGRFGYQRIDLGYQYAKQKEDEDKAGNNLNDRSQARSFSASAKLKYQTIAR